MSINGFVLLFSVLTALTGFAVSAFGISLSRIHRHKMKDTMRSLYPFFIYRSLASENNMVELSFALLSCAHLLRSIFTITLAYLLIDTSNINYVSLINTVGIGVLSGFVWDIIPRWIAGNEPKIVRKFLAFIASVTLIALFPVNKIMTKMFLTRNTKNVKCEFDFKNRMKEVIHEFEQTGDGDQTSKQILSGIIRYQDRTVKDIMVPRVKVFALSAHATLMEAAKRIIDDGFTRTPVYKDSIDNIIGIVITRDILELFVSMKNEKALDCNICKLVKPAFFVPETLGITHLLQEFKGKHSHLAVVVDEYGGTAGVVTIEDALEELVGDIEDEYDESYEREIFLDTDGSYIVDAKISLYTLEEQLNIVISKEAEYESLNGYIFHRTGFVPEPGFIISHDNFDLEVISSNERCVMTARVKLHNIQE